MKLLEKKDVNKEVKQELKYKCLFQTPGNTLKEQESKNLFAQVKDNVSEELTLILEFIDKYQKTMQPFISKTNCLIKYLVEEVYNLGTAQTIGSFGNNLHLPWSDLNIFVNCNTKKNFNNNKSECYNNLIERK